MTFNTGRLLIRNHAAAGAIIELDLPNKHLTKRLNRLQSITCADQATSGPEGQALLELSFRMAADGETGTVWERSNLVVVRGCIRGSQ